MSSDFRLIDPKKIIIERSERQRREIDVEADGLLGSIAKRGLMSPLIVDGTEAEPRLIAGERRLTCALRLSLTAVPVRFLSLMTSVERQIVELEENIKRSDLPWQDICRSVARVHKLFVETEREGWTLQLTANELSLSIGHVSNYCMIAEHLGDEAVARSGTWREAYNLLQRRFQRAQTAALEELLSPGEPPTQPMEFMNDETEETSPNVEGGVQPEQPARRDAESRVATRAPSGIICADFELFLSAYAGPKFNLVHADLPYGVGLFGSNGIRTGASRSQMGRDEGGGAPESYSDDPEVYRELTRGFLRLAPSVLSHSCHLVWWFSGKWEDEEWTRREFTRALPGVRWSRFPLVWHKTDNAGIASAPLYEPRHVYERALFGIMGQRQVVRVKSDVYGCPTDKSLHTSCKPQPMLRHFFEMLVDEHTVMLDPTCGSGSSIRAAESLNAKLALGLEIDPKMAEMAGLRLAEDRRKRDAARALGV